jgi:hypothetical protein
MNGMNERTEELGRTTFGSIKRPCTVSALGLGYIALGARIAS